MASELINMCPTRRSKVMFSNAAHRAGGLLAEWCGPAKMIAPILDEVSTAYEGKLQIAKMNVDENATFLPVWHSRHSHTDVVQRWPARATKWCPEQGSVDRVHRPATA